MSRSDKEDKTQGRDDGIVISVNFGTERTEAGELGMVRKMTTAGNSKSKGVEELRRENGYRNILLQMRGAQERSEETTLIPFLERYFLLLQLLGAGVSHPLFVLLMIYPSEMILFQFPPRTGMGGMARMAEREYFH